MSDEPLEQAAGGTAAAETRSNTEAQSNRLPAAARREVRRLRKLRKATFAAVVCFVAAGGVLAWDIGNAWALFVPALGILLVEGGVLCLCCLWWLRVSAARRLAEAADMRCVGSLISAVAMAGPWGTLDLRDALLPLLAKMRPSDYARLTTRQRRTVSGFLLAGGRRFWGAFSWLLPYRELRIAMLKMLEQCGGEECVPAVEYLAQHGDTRVRTVAQQCLGYLQVRMVEEGPAAKLLRPAEAPEEATLLRPAQARQETPEKQLLRPADDPNDEG